MKLFGRKIRIGKGIKNLAKGVGKVVRKAALPVALTVATGGAGGVLAGIAKTGIGSIVTNGAKRLLTRAPDIKLGRIPDVIEQARQIMNGSSGNDFQRTPPIVAPGPPQRNTQNQSIRSQASSRNQNLNLFDRFIQWLSDLFN